MIYRGHRKAPRHVFLFQEMMVFTRPIKVLRGVDEYRYKFSLKVGIQIGLIPRNQQSSQIENLENILLWCNIHELTVVGMLSATCCSH